MKSSSLSINVFITTRILADSLVQKSPFSGVPKISTHFMMITTQSISQVLFLISILFRASHLPREHLLFD